MRQATAGGLQGWERQALYLCDPLPASPLIRGRSRSRHKEVQSAERSPPLVKGRVREGSWFQSTITTGKLLQENRQRRRNHHTGNHRTDRNHARLFQLLFVVGVGARELVGNGFQHLFEMVGIGARRIRVD